MNRTMMRTAAAMLLTVSVMGTQCATAMASDATYELKNYTGLSVEQQAEDVDDEIIEYDDMIFFTYEGNGVIYFFDEDDEEMDYCEYEDDAVNAVEDYNAYLRSLPGLTETEKEELVEASNKIDSMCAEMESESDFNSNEEAMELERMITSLLYKSEASQMSNLSTEEQAEYAELMTELIFVDDITAEEEIEAINARLDELMGKEYDGCWELEYEENDDDDCDLPCFFDCAENDND